MRKRRGKTISHRAAGLAVSLAATAALLAGCGQFRIAGHKVVLTTGFLGDELFTVGEASGRESELRIYYTNLQREYESTFGEDIWSHEGNEGLPLAVKDNALARLAKVKVLNLMAKDAELSLSEEETAKAEQAATDYYDSLSAEEKTYFAADENEITAMYEEYALAGKEYDTIISAVSDEVSDDEARTVTCQQILIPTYEKDALGNRTDLDADGRAAAKVQADAILEEIRDGMENLTGVPFDNYVAKYNEADSGELIVAHDGSDPALEDAAFALDVGKISGVIETNDGYRILKCVKGFDRAQTDANKETILTKRRRDAFETAYDACIKDIDYNLDEDKYAEITLVTDPDISTDTFFTTYEQYFPE